MKFCVVFPRSLIAALLLIEGLAVVCRSEMVVISEIMYHPPRDEKPEFIEVSNNTATPFDFADWRLTDAVEYAFPPFSSAQPAAAFLGAFERIVLSSADAASTRAAYNIPESVRVFGPWAGRLNDREGRIVLQDKNGVIVCAVEYGDRGHWPAAADGAGHSLVLRDPNKTVDDWRNWTAGARPNGTPGTQPVFLAESPVPNPEIDLNQGIVLIDYGDVWRFHDGNQDLGSAWRAPGYNGQDWEEGSGLLGFETAALPAPGLRTSLNRANQLTFYFRKTFEYNGDPRGARFSIDQILDDGAVYYLNGVEIGRSRMPSGDVTFTTPSASTVSDAAEERDVLSAEGAPLVEGANVLAVEVHQTNPTSSDLVFGARLRVSAPTRAGVVINEVLPQTGGFIEFYNPTGNSVNLKDHHLSDNAANLEKAQIGIDVVIPAHGFGSIGFTESGFTPGPTLTVYLTAPDGVTPITAVKADTPPDGRSLGQKPGGSGAWFTFANSTRDQPNVSQQTLTGALRLNEVHFEPTGRVNWVEIYNAGDASAPLDGVFLSPNRDFSGGVALSGQIEPKGFARFDTSFTTGGEFTVYLVGDAGVVLDADLLEEPTRGATLQAFPDGSNHWYSSVASTPSAANDPERQTSIVIDEIMYDPPSNQVDGEYVELVNRGAESADLSGWEFSEGIDFKFPDGTVLQAGGYLVVAANAARLQSEYAGLAALGDFEGRLSNRGELIRLLDQWGNLVDEVDYKVGGDWPDLANGNGSSMELMNPRMDNSAGSAWKDSDETAKGPRRAYAYRDTFRQLRSFGGASDFKEIYFHLVGEGHVVLDDIQFVRVSTGQNLLVNAGKISTNAASASGWLCQGTHWLSTMTNGQFHIISEGRGDNRANRVELDATAVNSGDLCEIRFNARWVSGTPRLIFSTWDHIVANNFLLEVPSNLGTPGAANSRAALQPPPQIQRVLHSPAVPRATENVRITATVVSADPITAVELLHRADNDNGGGAWLTKPMFDDGVSGGDEVAGDGIYTADLTEYKTDGRIVQFYAQAKSANGQTSVLPKHGASRPALYVVDNRTTPRDLRVSRFVVSAYDLGAISDGNTPKYQYKFPRLSNDYKNATFISNEEEVFYNAEIRHSGSPWTRGGGLDRGKFKLPQDRAFRSHVKFYFDNDPEAGRMHHNRITRYWLYLLGHPTSENEFVRMIVNSGAPALREDTEFVGNDFLDRVFPDGSNGELYRIDDEWWFTDNWDRQQRDADWSHKGTDNPGRYRTEWMKRTREDEDDFTALISFFKKVSGQYTQAEIERLVDPEAVMKMFAVRGYIDDWDSISLTRGKNGFLYRRPTDGLFQFLQWDSDLTFGNVSAALYSGMPGVGPYISKPYNLRRFYYYIAEMVEKYTQNSPRLDAWFQAEEQASASFSVGAGQYRNWCNGRNPVCRQRMGGNYTLPFAITTNAGQPVTTSDNHVSISGTAPYGAFEVAAVGYPEAILNWTTLTTWTLEGIQLRSGENQIRVNSQDRVGQPQQQALITVTKTGNAPPVPRLSAEPSTWAVAVQDPLQLDARDSYDPEGSNLSLSWEISPGSALLDTNQPGQALASFQRPGWHTITLTAVDLTSQTSRISREIAVYGPDGLSSFDDGLEGFWNLENVAFLGNTPSASWLSLDDIPGELTIQLLGDTPQPVTANNARHPWVWRALPPGTAWSIETQVRLDTRVFGSFQTGIMVETLQSGAAVRYAFGIDGGRFTSVKRAQGEDAATELASVSRSTSMAILRIRRSGNQLSFDERIDDVWTTVHSMDLPAGTTTPRSGLFVAATEAGAVRVQFEYAALIDPSIEASLQSDLRVTELMYNPVENEDFEFIELGNLGLGTLDLTGASFTNGITFTFDSIQLAPGERVVLAKDVALFGLRYGTVAGPVVGGYEGRFDNSGERVTLVDANANLIFTFEYGTGGDWPGRPDGFGSSLESVNPRGDLNDPGNWRASRDYLGSPGTTGAGALKTVVINEVVANTDAPLEDAIELHNLTQNPVDLGGWFLSDSRSNYKKFRIPDGAILPPDGYKVFYERQLNTDNPLEPFSLSSTGEDVYLISADAAGNLAQFIDNVDFGPSDNGVSFGRFPNGTGPLVAMESLTLGSAISRTDPPSMIEVFRTGQGAVNGVPKVGPVVFSQIMYHPLDDESEFVEFVNITDRATPLYDPQNTTNTWVLSGGIDFAFPAGVSLPPYGAAVVTGVDPAVFRSRHTVPEATLVFGPFLGRLNNAGDMVELSKPAAPLATGADAGWVPYILVEKVQYASSPPWPALADGHGPALDRVNLFAYGNAGVNWAASLDETDPDTDRDGIPDWWEIANGFEPDNLADANLDTDGDGLSNRQEYLTGTDPRDSGSRFMVEAVRLDGAVIQIEFDAAADRSYLVQERNAMGQGEWSTVAEVPAASTKQPVQIELNLPPASLAGFYRIVAQ